MLLPSLRVRARWAPGHPAGLRARVGRELDHVAWTLSELEALLHEAQRVAGASHPYLAPRLELQLPLYDLRRRFRIVLARHDEATRIRLLDEAGKRVATLALEG